MRFQLPNTEYSQGSQNTIETRDSDRCTMGTARGRDFGSITGGMEKLHVCSREQGLYLVRQRSLGVFSESALRVKGAIYEKVCNFSNPQQL